MLNEKLSPLLGSVTDVAVMVGVTSAPDGAAAGGAKDAERLGAGLGVKVPHPGAHGPVLLANVHVTPAFAPSLVTVTLTGWAGPPTVADENLLVMLTEIGGATIVKLKLSVLLGSAAEAAVIVGEARAPAGTLAGG